VTSRHEVVLINKRDIGINHYNSDKPFAFVEHLNLQARGHLADSRIDELARLDISLTES
jgi:hypothetical protein